MDVLVPQIVKTISRFLTRSSRSDFLRGFLNRSLSNLLSCGVVVPTFAELTCFGLRGGVSALNVRLCLSVLPLNCFFHALDWTVLEPACVDGHSLAARCPCKIIPQICAPVTRPPVRPLCVFVSNLSLLFVFMLLHFVKSVLPFLTVVFTPSFLLVLALVLAKIASALVFVLLALALALAGLAFAFVVRARPSSRLAVLHVFSFLSTISRHVAVSSTP